MYTSRGPLLTSDTPTNGQNTNGPPKFSLKGRSGMTTDNLVQTNERKVEQMKFTRLCNQFEECLGVMKQFESTIKVSVIPDFENLFRAIGELNNKVEQMKDKTEGLNNLLETILEREERTESEMNQMKSFLGQLCTLMKQANSHINQPTQQENGDRSLSKLNNLSSGCRFSSSKSKHKKRNKKRHTQMLSGHDSSEDTSAKNVNTTTHKSQKTKPDDKTIKNKIKYTSKDSHLRNKSKRELSPKWTLRKIPNDEIKKASGNLDDITKDQCLSFSDWFDQYETSIVQTPEKATLTTDQNDSNVSADSEPLVAFCMTFPGSEEAVENIKELPKRALDIPNSDHSPKSKKKRQKVYSKVTKDTEGILESDEAMRPDALPTSTTLLKR